MALSPMHSVLTAGKGHEMLKTAIKRHLQGVLASLAPGVLRIRRGQLLVLMYHRILPPGDERLGTEQPGMVVHPETLGMQLRVIKKYFEIVHLDEWLDRTKRGQPVPARSCVLTFDDGWLDNYEYAYPILVREQAPATIFVVSDLVGSNQTFWPEQLATLLRRGMAQHGRKLFNHPAWTWLQDVNISLPQSINELSLDCIDRIISAAKQYPDSALLEKMDDMKAALTTDAYRQDLALMNWSQLREMSESGLVTVGSHTRRHTRLLPGITTEILQDEIAVSKSNIEKEMGRPVRLFCYPNGDASPDAIAMVKKHYLGACSTLHGWCRPNDDRHMIRRIGIHQDIAFDETSFLARLTGWI